MYHLTKRGYPEPALEQCNEAKKMLQYDNRYQIKLLLVECDIYYGMRNWEKEAVSLKAVEKLLETSGQKETPAARLADELRLLTRERTVYRDVVNVAVGDDAEKDIDEHLRISDVLIFLQTEHAQHSKYIMKELCYALLNDIPILWIQIDNAPYPNKGAYMAVDHYTIHSHE